MLTQNVGNPFDRFAGWIDISGKSTHLGMPGNLHNFRGGESCLDYSYVLDREI